MANKLETIKTWGLRIIGVLAIIGVGVITITTINKFNTSKLFSSIREYFFLKKKGYKRDDDVVKTPSGDVAIPEPVSGEVTGAGNTESHSNEDTSNNDLQSGEGEINHEVVDRKNTKPVENSFKYKKKQLDSKH
jgi:hypothetical protein